MTAWSQLQYDTLSDGCGCNLAASGASYQWIPKQKYYEEQVNLISPTDGPFFSKLNWIAGATWFYKDTGVTSGSATESPPYSAALPRYSFSNTDTVYRLEGLFGQISWQMLPTLQLQVGARSNWDNTAIRGTINQTETPGRIAATAPSTGCFETSAPATGYVCSTPNMYGENHGQRADRQDRSELDTAERSVLLCLLRARFTRVKVSTPREPHSRRCRRPRSFLSTSMTGRRAGTASSSTTIMTTHLGGYWMVDQNSQQAGIFFPLTGGTVVGNLGSEKLKGIEATLNGRFGGLGGELRCRL